MANVNENTIKLLEEMGYNVTFCDQHENPCDVSEATKAIVLVISSVTIKTLSLPKKELDINWFLDKLENNKLYRNLSTTFAKILDISGNACVYATTYGIGFTNFIFRDLETAKKLKTILDQHGIEYRTEYSDALYVFRFVISKRKENVAKINGLISANKV